MSHYPLYCDYIKARHNLQVFFVQNHKEISQ